MIRRDLRFRVRLTNGEEFTGAGFDPDDKELRQKWVDALKPRQSLTADIPLAGGGRLRFDCVDLVRVVEETVRREPTPAERAADEKRERELNERFARQREAEMRELNAKYPPGTPVVFAHGFESGAVVDHITLGGWVVVRWPSGRRKSMHPSRVFTAEEGVPS